MKKAIVILLVALIAIGFCFAGGGSEEKVSSESNTKTESHIPEGEPPKGTIELVMWDDVATAAHETLTAAAESFRPAPLTARPAYRSSTS